MSCYIELKTRFNNVETVFLLFVKAEGYFTKASNKELAPPFLTLKRHRVLSKYIFTLFYYIMLIYTLSLRVDNG